MALNGKHHFEEACEGAKFVAHELRRYARICAQYLRKSTTGREDLKDSITDAYVSLLRYCGALRSLGDPSFFGKPFPELWHVSLFEMLLTCSLRAISARAKRNLDSKNPLDPLRKQYQETDAHVQECIERVVHESKEPNHPAFGKGS